jgi:hypothetical protein
MTSVMTRLPKATRLFVVAWAIAVVGGVLGENGDGWFALLAPSGLVMMRAGWLLRTDDGAWREFYEAWSRGVRQIASPGAQRFARTTWYGGMLLIGAVFTLGGVLGVLAAFGLYDFPS